MAEVPELPGCRAHGPAQDAIALWIDTVREHGDTVPEPKGERLMRA